MLDDYRDEIIYAYSTRAGGISTGCYESMNLSNSVGDDPEIVRENYRIWLGGYGIDIKDVVSLQQVHSDKVLVVRDEHRSSGPIEGRIPGTDAMVTDVPGIALVTGHADCVPVYVYDPCRRAIGLAHAGWRGTVLAIAARTVEAMIREYGSDPADMHAYIGPCIQIKRFECDRDVIEEIDKMDIDSSSFYYYNSDTGKYHASLPEINRAVLMASGVPEGNIGTSDHCTYDMPELYFSHRRQGSSRGGQAALMMIM